MNVLILLALTAPLAAASPPSLSLADLLARSRVSPEEAAAESTLAAAERHLAASSDRLPETWSLGVSAGPRWTDDSTRGDLSLEIEVPLWRGREPRSEVRTALSELAKIWRAEARVKRDGRIVAAYLAAYGAEQRIVLRREELATLERLLAVARRRVEAGADPPYEATLVEAELASASLALAQAEGEHSRSWAELAIWVDLPAEPVPLAAPAEGLPPFLSFSEQVGDPRTAFAASALARGPSARAALAAAVATLESARDQARFSLKGAVALEGEERVARVGAAYRVPRGGELEAIRRQAETAAAAARRDAELEVAHWAARLEATLGQRSALERAPPVVGTEIALAALELRLTTGKAQPSEVLLLRRQLLTARQSALDFELARAAVATELALLTQEVQP